MADINEEERCIAITGRGTRCSRVAKDSRFCFQHDESNETVETQASADAGLANWLSSELETRAGQASDIQRDIYMNLADMQSGLQNAVDDFRSGNRSLDALFERFEETAEEVGGLRSRSVGWFDRGETWSRNHTMARVAPGAKSAPSTSWPTIPESEPSRQGYS